jgi:PAS domain S-box-containing protein
MLNSVFPGDGEMANLMRSHDWSKTPLGAVEQWPQSLRTTVSLVLSSRYPMFLWWGQEYINFYNDAYRPILGASKHPQFLGQPAKDCWTEIWDVVGAMADSVFTKGESTWSENLLLLIYRYGYVEEAYFTFSYSPVRDESGGIGGVFCAVSETTEQVIGDRRLQTLRELASKTADAKTSAAACNIALQTLAQNSADIPFALLYLSDGKQAELVANTGILASPQQVDLSQEDDVWHLGEVNRTGQAEKINDLEQRFGKVPGGLWDISPTEALVIPIAESGKANIAGFLVLGISPNRKFDDNYQGFFDLVANQVATAIASAQAYEAERQRAEALAEIDRAKTLFFSNVSHEFRTPLTLILAPIEDALADTENPLPAIQRDRIEVVQRNGQRLLKLVNTLLDFSRIEAGRVEAVYEPTDLATFTTDLASTFRSLIERAGLSLEINCPPLSTLIYVDRGMWEKIIFNLLSNAFKFTFSGTITVALEDYLNHVDLTIQDTGIGIPPEEIPHLFERFYRVKGASGRSFEGSGIGLSLVHELIKLHGGNITVTSQLGQGSCFKILIPTGTAHLAISEIRRSRESTTLRSSAYIEEAWRWLTDVNSDAIKLSELNTEINPIPAPQTTKKSRILLVEDNADMRDYVKRLLEQRYIVETASDGVAALIAINQCKPDLVLTDVMMPRLDGFGLLQQLRSQPETRELPIILLSARAGEEARVEGLESGADDYLIKPFSTRELLARVETNLKMAQLRQEVAVRENTLRVSAEQAQIEAREISDRLTRILESMGDGFIALDNNWQITYINASGEKINNGKSRTEVLGKTIWEAWPALLGTNAEYQYRRAIAEQIPVDFELHYYTPSEYNVWLEIHAYPNRDGLGIFFRDISERKQTEAVLQENQIQLQQQLAEIEAIYQSAPIGLNFLDTDLRFVRINQRLAEMNGHSVEAHLGRTVRELLPDLADTAEKLFYSILETGEPLLNVEITGETPAQPGVQRTWLEHFIPLKKGDKIIGINTVCEEITERKRIAAALQENQVLLQAVLDNSKTVIYIKDIHGKYLLVNRQYEILTNHRQSEIIGKTDFQLFPQEIFQTFWENDYRVLRTQTQVSSEEQIADTDGIHTYFAIKFPLYHSNGEMFALCGMLTDITKRKQAETALQRLNEELESKIAERTAELQQELWQREEIEQHLSQVEKRFQAFMNHNPACVWIADTNGKIIYTNQAYSLTFKLLRQQPIGRNIFELYPAEIAEQFINSIQVVADKQQTIETTQIFPKIDGTIGEFLVYNFPLSDSSESQLVGGIAVDITERKHLEKELALREAWLNAFFMHNPVGMAILDDNLRFVQVNKQIADMGGLSIEQHLGKSVFELFPTFASAHESIYRQIFTTGQPLINIEISWEDLRNPGTIGYWLMSYQPILNTDNQIIGMSYVAIDISDRKRIEDALQASEIRYRAIIEDQTEMIARFSADSTLLFVNDAYCRYFNVSQDEVINNSYSPVIFEEDLEKVNQLLQSMSASNPTVTIENRVINGRGEVRWTQWVNRMLLDEQGNLIELQAVGRDINDLKQVEQALRHSEEQRRLALDLTHIGFWDLHLPSGDLIWNENHFTLLGLPANTAQARYEDWRDRIHPEDVERVEQGFKNSIETHTDYQIEYRVVYPDGSVHWLMARGRAIYDQQDQPLRSLGVILDISDRKHIEATLQESDRRWRSLLDNVQLVVIGLDIHANVEYVNPFFLELTGYQKEEVLGQYWFDFLNPEQQNSVKVVFREVLEHNFHPYYQNPVLTKAGEERMIAWSNTILRDVAGQPIGTISIGEDITERYKVERMKAEFISVVSHELRTPLTSMQAALSLLSEKIIDPNSEEGEATIQIATEGTDRLVRLVNDILDLERLESGKIRLEKHICNVGDLMETAIAQMQEMANQGNITLKSAPHPFKIEADSDRILQVITNLLSNAIKFSPNNSTIQLSVKQQSNDTGTFLRFMVRDRGRGIPADNLESIFARFHQVDASDSREKGGTGLGLAICRSIVQQHGGEIWAESTLGKGSTFYFTLPLKQLSVIRNLIGSPSADN